MNALLTPAPDADLIKESNDEAHPTNDALEAVLAAAARAFARGRADYRDSLIETGLAIQEYLEGRAALADGLTNHERAKRRYTRERVLRHVAERLGVTAGKPSELVRMAMTAKLLSADEDCQCGKMGYHLLRPLSKYVRRLPGWVGTGAAKAAQAGVTLVTLAQREQWAIYTGYEDEAKALFSRAAAGELTRKQLDRLCKPSTKGPRRLKNWGPSIVNRPESNRPIDAVCVIARTCAPQDLADLILRLIGQARNREAVARILMERLDPKPRQPQPRHDGGPGTGTTADRRGASP